MKYIVVVNQKWIVSVEANSALGAEHYILNNFSGIDGAQAFTKKELNTDCFEWFLQNGEMISEDELREKSDTYEKAVEMFADARSKVVETGDRIAELKMLLEQAEAEYEKRETEMYGAEGAYWSVSAGIGHKVA